VAVLLATVAAGSRARLGGTGMLPAAGRLPGAAQAALDVALPPVLLGCLALLVLITAALKPMRRRKRQPDEPDWIIEEPPTPWWGKLVLVLVPLLVLGGGVLAAFVIAGQHHGGSPPLAPPSAFGPPHLPGAAPPGPGAETARQRAAASLAWVVTGAVAAVGLLAAGVAVVVRARASRRASGGGWRPASREAVAAALGEAVEDLRRERDPRRAVVGAYACMERTLTPYGLGRRSAEAPREYLRRILGQLQASPEAARELTDLYQRAKFSPHVVDEGMREAAIGALETIRVGLASASPAGAASDSASGAASQSSGPGREGAR